MATDPNFPDNLGPCVFSASIAIRWGDLDAFGHVNNALYFKYLEEARFLWLIEKKIPFDGATCPVLINIGCTFLQPVFHPDNLRVDIYIGSVGRSSFMAYYRLFSSKDPINPCSQAYSKIVWVDRSSGKSVPLPDAVRAWFE
jgi:acyl-CoA thioester hydrolase